MAEEKNVFVLQSRPWKLKFLALQINSSKQKLSRNTKRINHEHLFFKNVFEEII